MEAGTPRGHEIVAVNWSHPIPFPLIGDFHRAFGGARLGLCR